MRSINFFDPYMTIAINKPKTKDDLKRMFLALKLVAEDDSSFLVYTNDTSKQTIIAGKGEQHLNSIVGRLTSELNIEFDVEKPKVLYKETIRKTVRSEGRYIRQSSCPSKYGHCWIEIEPKLRDTGYEFINKIIDENVIPSEYIPSINEGILQAMKSGVLGGYPVVDVKVTLYDGSFHQVDSSELSFKIAGYKAFTEGIKQSDPVILEPIMNLTFEAMESDIPELIDGIYSVRGRNEEIKLTSCVWVFTADVPLRELNDFINRLSSKIRGNFSVKFGYYDKIPDSIKESVIQESSLQGAEYTDLFMGSKWGKESEERRLNDFIELFWK